MGLRGPTPQPLSTRSRNGTHAPTLAGTPADQLGKASCPDWLADAAKAFWAQHAPDLEAKGLLTALDEAAFALLCAAWADVRAADAILASEGLIVTTPRGIVRPHPALKVKRDAERLYLDVARQFGLTPASRGRVPVAPPAKPRLATRDRSAG